MLPVSAQSRFRPLHKPKHGETVGEVRGRRVHGRAQYWPVISVAAYARKSLKPSRFVRLEKAAFQIAKNFTLIIRVRLARLAEKLDDCVNRNICETCGRSD